MTVFYGFNLLNVYSVQVLVTLKISNYKMISNKYYVNLWLFRKNRIRLYMIKIFTIFLLLLEFLMGSSVSSLKVNGKSVPFIFEENRQLPIVSLQLVFQVSGVITDKDLSGVANMSASIMNEGSAVLGTEKFSEMLEENAINLSSGVGTETFVIRLDSLKENFSKGVELLIELLKEPNLKKSVLSRIKNSVKGRILQKNSDFDYVASNELKKMIFEGTILSKPKIGTIEDIEKIKLSDIKKFLKNSLTIANIIPIIGGDISENEAKDILLKIISNLKDGNFETLPTFQFSQNKRENILIRETKQTYIYFASPLNIKYSDTELYKMKVMFFILGSSGFGSRLMEEIRVKNGLAYSIYANGNIEKSRSYFSGYLQTKTENLEKAKDLVISVISDFLEKGVTEKELSSAQAFILGSEPLRNETLSQRIGQAFNEYYRGFPLGERKRELELIRNLKLSELNYFIKSHKEILELSFSILTAK